MRITIVTNCIADISPSEQLSVSQRVYTSIFPHTRLCDCNCASADACLARTNWYNYISGFYLLASVGGLWVGSLLLSQHVYLQNCISIACYILTTCVSVAIPSHCGRDEQHDESSGLIIPDQEDDDFDSPPPSSAANAVLSLNFNPEVTPLQSSIYVPPTDCATQASPLSPSHRPQILAHILPICVHPLFNLLPNIYYSPDLPP